MPGPRYDPTTPDHTPARLEPGFAPASAAVPGCDCSSATARAGRRTTVPALTALRYRLLKRAAGRSV